MAEHDDVLHLERLHAEFERRRHAVLRAVRRIGRHEVGDVAHHEQLARAARRKSPPASTRESQQPITMICGDWPLSQLAIAVLLVRAAG